MLPTKFRFIWLSGFRGEDFFQSANQKQELPVATMFVNGLGQNKQIYRGPSIDALLSELCLMIPSIILHTFLTQLAKGNVSFCHH
jgi:hypothetical protein